MKTNHNAYLVNADPGDQRKNNPKILRVIVSSDCTQIDFGYVAPWIYERGGWIHIAPATYIQVKGSKKKYALTEAKNIPLAPQKLEFESTEDWRVFSLIFEPIPLKNCIIDMIEAENPTEDDFNFYNIKLTNVTQVEVLNQT